MKSENIFEIDERIPATLFKSTGTSWRCMKSGCGSQRKSYGGKGIKYPKRWESFDCFVRDMGIRPEGKTLNRKDNSKNYSKKNCNWATWEEQANNRGNNVQIKFKGKTQNTLAWAKELGINRTTIEERMENMNRSYHVRHN